MGKSCGNKKKQRGEKAAGNSDSGPSTAAENSPKAYDEDTAIFIANSQELKDEGNKLFQKRDYEGAMLKYEKAIKLLPGNHIDVAYLRSNMAACYMQMGIGDYPRAVHECNLALEVSPKYTKALIKRARCYEGLNRFPLALRDINAALDMEPNNLTALEIAERLKKTMQDQRNLVNGNPIHSIPRSIEPSCASSSEKEVKEKTKKKNSKTEKKRVEKEAIKVMDSNKPKNEDKDEMKAEDKVVMEEKLNDANKDAEVKKKTVKLAFGEDIRMAQIPPECSLFYLREIIKNRFPKLRAFLVKYTDQEGDMITITNDEELKWAEESTNPHSLARLHVVEVDPEYDPFDEIPREKSSFSHSVFENGYENASIKKDIEIPRRASCIEPWIIKFAHLFKNYVGLSSDTYIDLHDEGSKLYSEAMEEVITSEEAQALFDIAGQKFQEMAALALLNWGNVHMARARRRIHFAEESSREFILAQVKHAYGWAQKEHIVAGQRYEEALNIKPDFYQAHLALGHQQFEQAKLAWYYAVANSVDLNTWSYEEVIDLYNKAEDNVQKGVQIWEKLEQQEQHKLTGESEVHKRDLVNDILDGIPLKDHCSNKSPIYIVWGTILYERSIMEYKLQLPVWLECLEVAMEKFELAGASPTELGVMVKNHCSNAAAQDGLGFKIDEIVQAWNEMDEAKRWYTGLPSFRMEPLLRRRVSKLYHALEQT